MKLTKTKVQVLKIIIFCVLFILTGCGFTYIKPGPSIKSSERAQLIYHHGFSLLPEMEKTHKIHIKRDIIIHIVKEDNPYLKRYGAAGVVRQLTFPHLDSEPYQIWVKGKMVKGKVVPHIFALGHEIQHLLNWEASEIVANPHN